MAFSYNFHESYYIGRRNSNSNSNEFQCNQELKEHPFMNTVRSKVLAYRLLSPQHFDLSISILQATPFPCEDAEIELTPKFRIEIAFTSFSEPDIRRLCRPKFRLRSRKSTQVLTNDVQICEKRRFIPMTKYLGIHYPPSNERVENEVMQRWWEANGKTFNWTGLPTELKEHVILSCLHQPLGKGLYQDILLRKRNPKNPESIDPHEIADKLTDWYQVLGVSHQVRAIALRLCFMGSSGVAYSKGLCIAPCSYGAFKISIDRLGNYYQMMKPHRLPTDEKTRALAECYQRFPKIYPQLSQYATFRHGVQKICLNMSMVSYMRFFKVDIGGFSNYWQADHSTYEVLEQFPALNEIFVKLPKRPEGVKGWYNNPHEGGPPLFHHEFPCFRILHRIIYERIAETLAPYQHVYLGRFMDHDEKQRYQEFRKAAIKKLKITSHELEELYQDDGGGIALEEDVAVPVATVEVKEDTQSDVGFLDYNQDRFFPPNCRCARKCNSYSDGGE